MLSSVSSPREAAYFALISSDKEHIESTLEIWQKLNKPASKDLRLAKELAFGTIKRLSSLDFLAKQLTSTGKLNLKSKEKMLLRMAIYQFVFMERIPFYAIVDEKVGLAKKHFGMKTANFFNAVLRKAKDLKLELPRTENPVEDLAIFYSYPTFFVKKLMSEYGLKKAKEIMEVQNHFFPPTVRLRKKAGDTLLKGKELHYLLDGTFEVVQIPKDVEITSIAANPDFYIQNATPAFLIASLAKDIPSPKTILDLCAAPGGKLLACRDLFPEAELFANDVSEEKCALIRDNLRKYGAFSHISCQRGEVYQAFQKFDLIVLDVPCSNSGVLHKRPEARWRLLPENLKQLEELQIAIVKNAASLLNPGGQIWYLTCSILREENEDLIKKVCQRFRLKVFGKMLSVLPNDQGLDGGFGCALKSL